MEPSSPPTSRFFQKYLLEAHRKLEMHEPQFKKYWRKRWAQLLQIKCLSASCLIRVDHLWLKAVVPDKVQTSDVLICQPKTYIMHLIHALLPRISNNKSYQNPFLPGLTFLIQTVKDGGKEVMEGKDKNVSQQVRHLCQVRAWCSTGAWAKCKGGIPFAH